MLQIPLAYAARIYQEVCCAEPTSSTVYVLHIIAYSSSKYKQYIQTLVNSSAHGGHCAPASTEYLTLHLTIAYATSYYAPG